MEWKKWIVGEFEYNRNEYEDDNGELTEKTSYKISVGLIPVTCIVALLWWVIF